VLPELIIGGQQHLGVVWGALVCCSVWEPAHGCAVTGWGRPPSGAGGVPRNAPTPGIASLSTSALGVSGAVTSLASGPFRAGVAGFESLPSPGGALTAQASNTRREKSGTCVPRNAAALFPGWRGLVVRLSWARLGHPRSPVPGLRAGGLGRSRFLRVRPLACRRGRVGIITEFRGCVSGRSRRGGTPYFDETVTAGCPRHYPLVPTTTPAPAKRKLRTPLSAFRGTHRTPRKCQTPLSS
jgi:hypothetical protein